MSNKFDTPDVYRAELVQPVDSQRSCLLPAIVVGLVLVIAVVTAWPL